MLRTFLTAMAIGCVTFSVAAQEPKGDPVAPVEEYEKPVEADRPDIASVKLAVQRFQAASATEDIAAYARLWADDSPTRASLLEQQKKFYEQVEGLRLKSFRFSFIKFAEEGQLARAKVETAYQGKNVSTGADYFSGSTFSTVHLRRRDGRWMIWDTKRPDDELIGQLALARTRTARHALLDELAESGSDVQNRLRFGFLAISLSTIDDPRRRHQILLEEPEIRESDYPIHLLVFRALRDTSTFDNANHILDVAFEIADFHDQVVPLAWCHQHRGILLERHQKYPEALQSLNRARDLLNTFAEIDLQDERIADQMVTLIHLGRVEAQLGNRDESRQAFETAKELYDRAKSVIVSSKEYSTRRIYLYKLGQAAQLEAAALADLDRGELDDAEKSLRQLLAIETEIYGPINAEIIATYGHLARIAGYQDRSDEARANADLAAAVAARYSREESGEYRFALWTRRHVERIAGLSKEDRASLRDAGTFRLTRNVTQVLEGGKPEIALPVATHSVEAAQRLLGDDDFLTAVARCQLARLYDRQDRNSEADQLYAQAAVVFRRVVGSDAKDYDAAWLTFLNKLVNQHWQAYEFDKARYWKQKYLQETEIDHGADSEIARDRRMHWEFIDRAAGLTAEQIDQLRQCDESVHKARTLSEERRWSEAEQLLNEAVETYARLLGNQNHPKAEAEVWLALAHAQLGNFARMEKLLRSALPYYSTPSRLRWEILKSLAVASYLNGKFVEAEHLQAEAVALSRSVFGYDSAEHVETLQGHAACLSFLGRDRESQLATYKAVIVQKQRLLPKEHRDYQGPKIILSFSTDQVRGSEEHRIYAELLRELGAKYGGGANGREAGKSLLSYAANLLEQIDGTRETDQYARVAISLCLVLHDTGDLDAAIKTAEETLAYLERRKDTSKWTLQRFDTLAMLNRRLGSFYATKGRLDESHRLLRRAADLMVQSGQSRISSFLMEGALVQFARGKHADALNDANAAMSMLLRELQDFIRHGTAVSIRSFLDHQVPDPAYVQSMAISCDDPAAQRRYIELAFTATLQFHALVTEVLCRHRETQQLLAANPQIAKLGREFEEVRQKHSNFSLNPPEGLSQFEIAARLNDLQQHAGRLEAELNQALMQAGLNSDASIDGKELKIEALRKHLPARTTMVHFVRQFPYDFHNMKHFGQAKYYAFVLTADSNVPVQVVELGDADGIDKLVADYRTKVNFALRSYEATSRDNLGPAEEEWTADLDDTSRELYSLLIDRLKPAVGDAETWFIVPEGELNRIPFEALVDADGKYFIESTRVAYLTSARDLLRPAYEPGDAKGTAIFAAADFDLERRESDTPTAPQLAQADPPKPVALRGDVSNDVRGMRWKKLDGTVTEAAEIQKLLNESPYGPIVPHLGAHALEDKLKQLPPPRVLHLATHGYFLEDEKVDSERGSSALDAGVEFAQARGFARLRKSDNPLLRSGIVLSGANQLGRQKIGDDGWVTAQEIALLDLHGTELVVLSACESGLGKIRTGEGVQGLKVAFRYAGARTLISTLFKVPDTPTQELMTKFYTRLKAGSSKLDSLRGAQLDIIQERRANHGVAHPLFWGSFVLSGDPN